MYLNYVWISLLRYIPRTFNFTNSSDIDHIIKQFTFDLNNEL